VLVALMCTTPCCLSQHVDSMLQCLLVFSLEFVGCCSTAQASLCCFCCKLCCCQSNCYRSTRHGHNSNSVKGRVAVVMSVGLTVLPQLACMWLAATSGGPVALGT
jgi:hypothetical protein